MGFAGFYRDPSAMQQQQDLVTEFTNFAPKHRQRTKSEHHNVMTEQQPVRYGGRWSDTQQPHIQPLQIVYKQLQPCNSEYTLALQQ